MVVETSSPAAGTDTLPEMLDAVAAKYPDREAIVGDGRRLTYADLQDHVHAFARGLLDIGVRKGDKVGILFSNRPEWFIATYGALRLGATVVALNTWHTPEELRYALRKTDTSTLIAQDSFLENQFLDMVESIAPGVADSAADRLHTHSLPQLRTVVAEGETRDWAHSWNTIVDRGKDLSSQLDAEARKTVQRDDPAYILFSSGTTGRPKPIMLRHDGLVTNSQAVGATMDVSADDRFWLALPLFFSFAACNESITAIAHGATLVLQEQFSADQALERIEAESCTVLYAMANMLRRMESATNSLTDRLTSARVGMTIAPSSLRKRYEKEYDVKMLTGYGLTEVCAICTLTPIDESAEQRHETVGRLLPNVDLRIVDPQTGREVAPGERGRIRLQTRTLFTEYYGMPEQMGQTFDADGYFKTGDIGRLTSDGHLQFEGRAKDMIKTGGINVSPGEVEDALERHSDVAEATVLALPDDEKDELVAAVVRTTAGDLKPADVRNFVAERLSTYKVPEVVSIQDGDFPRTDTGKVKKRELRDNLDRE